MEARLILAVDLCAYLEGTWEIARSIDDRQNGSTGSFTGQAAFVPRPDGLDYREHGHLKTADFEDKVHQHYIYRFAEPNLAAVSFSDDRAFHDLDLSAGLWRASYPCGPDVYDGEFEQADDDCWRSQWIIRGPRKNMTIRSTYTRMMAIK